MAASEEARRSAPGRRILRVLAIAGAASITWWLTSEWIGRRWGFPSDLVRYAMLLVYSVLISIASPRFARSQSGSRRKWLGLTRQTESFDSYDSWSRKFWVVALLLMLPTQVLALLVPKLAKAPAHSLDPTIILLVASSFGLHWDVGQAGDERSRWVYLVAANRALFVILCSSAAALIATSGRAATLQPALEMALLLGCLTLNLSIVFDNRRAGAIAD